MSCEKFELSIALLIEGELGAAAAHSLNLHLADCAVCRQFAAELQESQQALKAAAVIDFDETMLADLRREVMKEIAARPQSLWSRLFLRGRWQYAFATSMLLIAMILPALVWLRAEREPAVRPPVAAVNEKIVRPAPPAKQILPTRKPASDNARVIAVKRTRLAVNEPRVTSVTSGPKEASELSEPMRMEIKTSDPNVRIIWFVNQPAEKLTPS
jgi:anti-sigma factor RsiW